jgi:branched-chain amino acid transport system permease protein
MRDLSQLPLLLLGGLRIGAIYALSAIGLVVIHKATRTVNFAHGAFIMLGSYGAYMGVERLHIPYWTVYLLVPVLVGLFAAALEFSLLRRLRSADAFSTVITTVFISVLLTEAARLEFESDILNVPSFISLPPLLLRSIVLTWETVWIVGGALVCGIAGAYIFAGASIGRAMRAMAASMRGAQLCGYSVDAVHAQAWLLGGGLAGLAGVFVAPRLGVSPELAFATIIPAFVAAIIGGFDSLKGAILGGLLLGIVETLTAAYLSGALKNALSMLILLLVLLFKPEGLFPEQRARRV